MATPEPFAPADHLQHSDDTPFRRVFASELIGREGGLIVVYRGKEYLLTCMPEAGELVLIKAVGEQAGNVGRCRFREGLIAREAGTAP